MITRSLDRLVRVFFSWSINCDDAPLLRHFSWEEIAYSKEVSISSIGGRVGYSQGKQTMAFSSPIAASHLSALSHLI